MKDNGEEPNGTKAPGIRIGRVFVSNIILLGLTSLFIDMSTEMVYPLIPLLLASFGATPAIIGLIEGIAESIAAFLKVASGWWGDRTGDEKKLTVVGYCASIAYKIILLVSTSWGGVLIARMADRLGKGIRTAPRDALIAASGGDKKLGRAFGLHKMMDMLGAALGVALSLLVVASGLSFRAAFVYSIIPAALGVGVLTLVRRVRAPRGKAERFSLKGFRLRDPLAAYLGVIFLFCVGNSSNAFLLLRAGAAGLDSKQVILMYLIYNVSASLFAYPMGRLSDRVGRAKLLIPGYFLYGVTYFGFAGVGSGIAMPVLFVLYGLYTAMISGAERAFIAEQAGTAYRGTVLGLYGMCQGFGLLAASLLAGALWSGYGAGAPFLFGGTLGILSALALGVIFVVMRKKANA